jgi:hypothetical protein
MMQENYSILGLTEDATDEEIESRYVYLRDKYKEERWQDGAAGNEAAKMLTKVEVAYKEIMADRKDRQKTTGGANSFEEIAALIKADNLGDAQARLDEFNERPAEWHYLQAVIYYKKNWTNESKKQLEIAMEMDPDCQKYRDAYGKLNARTQYQNQSAQQQNPYASAQPQDDPTEQQMGGNACSQCVSCCYTYLCVDCLFTLCCGCR